MAWGTSQEKDNQRWFEFHYFKSGNANGFENESINIGKRFKLTQVRLHLDSTFVSTEDLVVYVSSTDGSQHNIKILSQPMSDIQDFIVIYSDAIIQRSDDQMVFEFSMVSATHLWGLHLSLRLVIQTEIYIQHNCICNKMSRLQYVG